MEYIYFLGNASLTLRIIKHLRRMPYLSLSIMTVIHQIDGWIIRIRLASPLNKTHDGDFRAYLSELGIPYQPDIRFQMIFWGLDTGQPPIDVMRRYQVAIVSHGKPDCADIVAFRQQFTRGLGYCPETLA